MLKRRLFPSLCLTIFSLCRRFDMRDGLFSSGKDTSVMPEEHVGQEDAKGVYRPDILRTRLLWLERLSEKLLKPVHDRTRRLI